MRAVICDAVAAIGMAGPVPGLTGGTNATADRVSYSSGEIVRYNKPSFPYPRLDWTDAAFAFNWRLSSAMDS